MAGPGRSIFNERATRRLHSPDDLDKYVRVTSPRVWTVLACCIALLAGLLAWGLFGAVSTTVEVKGAVMGSDMLCFVGLDHAGEIDLGDEARVGGLQMRVSEVSRVPLSREEAAELLGSDFLASTLVPQDWAYQLRLDGDCSKLASGVPQTVVITTERTRPIELVWDK